jgi:hypothetical protein
MNASIRTGKSTATSTITASASVAPAAVPKLQPHGGLLLPEHPSGCEGGCEGGPLSRGDSSSAADSPVIRQRLQPCYLVAGRLVISLHVDRRIDRAWWVYTAWRCSALLWRQTNRCDELSLELLDAAERVHGTGQQGRKHAAVQ